MASCVEAVQPDTIPDAIHGVVAQQIVELICSAFERCWHVDQTMTRTRGATEFAVDPCWHVRRPRNSCGVPPLTPGQVDKCVSQAASRTNNVDNRQSRVTTIVPSAKLDLRLEQIPCARVLDLGHLHPDPTCVLDGGERSGEGSH